VDEQSQVKIRRRRSRAEVEQLVAEYEASGLSRMAFCQRRGLSLSTLVRYQRRQQQTTGEAASGKRWLAVEVSGAATVTGAGAASGLAVLLRGGRRIEIGRGFDADTLQQLLGVMERC
jgi:hypothetical protein